MPDKYDKAIARLKAAEDFSEAVWMAWCNPSKNENGCLFKFVAPTMAIARANHECGCLTMIAHGDDRVALNIKGKEDVALTNRIRKDARIPDDTASIKPETLEVFANWQREISDHYKKQKAKARAKA